jgi:hypothetical protein
MRSSPEDVQAWCSGSCAVGVVSARLAALRDDPNWQVTASQGTSIQSVNLLYHPTGEHVGIRLLRDGPVYHLRLQPGMLHAA